MGRASGSRTTIAVDALAVSRKSAGSFTVLLGLMRELMELCDYDFVIYTVCDDVEKKLGECGGRIKYIYAPIWTKVFVLRCLWQQSVLPSLAKKAGCRLLYSASGYPELFTRLPVVSHQQNLWSFTKPQPWWPYRSRIKVFGCRAIARLALKYSRANIFISDYLRKSANEMVPCAQEKNFTVYNAISHDCLSTCISPEVTTLKREFCICVGSFMVHKNYIKLLQAFKIVAEKCPSLDLIIVGSYETNYGRKVQNLYQQLDLQNRVVFRGSLDFNSIINLYHRAKFSINISLLEGFGLPILESMAVGCPVICSKSTAFPEIGDDTVCYCDPQEPDDIAEKMLTLCQDEVFRKKLSELGLERAQKFTWKKSASILLNIFDKVIKEGLSNVS